MDRRDLTLRLDPAALRRAAAAAAALTAVFIAATAARWRIGDGTDGIGATLLRHADLVSEDVLATWWAATLLLCVSAAAALCAGAYRWGNGGRIVALGWLGVAAAAALMSLDELGSIHERIGVAQRASAPSEILRKTDLLVLAFLLGAGPTVGFIHFLRRQHRRSAALVIAGLGCFALALFAENGGAMLWGEPPPGESDSRHLPSLLLEEGGELAGVLCLLFAAIHYLGESASPARIALRAVRLAGLALPVMFGLGMIIALAVQLPVPEKVSVGDPVAWFPSMLAVGSAAGALLLGFRGSERAVVFAFAALATVVAIDVGAGELLSEQIWPGSPRRRIAVAVAVALVAGGTSLLAWHARLSTPLQMATILWAAGVSAGWVATGHVRSVLLYAAHATILPALAYAVARRAPIPSGAVAELVPVGGGTGR